MTKNQVLRPSYWRMKGNICETYQLETQRASRHPSAPPEASSIPSLAGAPRPHHPRACPRAPLSITNYKNWPQTDPMTIPVSLREVSSNSSDSEPDTVSRLNRSNTTQQKLKSRCNLWRSASRVRWRSNSLQGAHDDAFHCGWWGPLSCRSSPRSCIQGPLAPPPSRLGERGLFPWVKGELLCFPRVWTTFE